MPMLFLQSFVSKTFDFGLDQNISIKGIFFAVILCALAWLFVKLMRSKVINPFFKRNNYEKDKIEIVNITFKYIIYIFTFFMAMQIAGFNLSGLMNKTFSISEKQTVSVKGVLIAFLFLLTIWLLVNLFVKLILGPLMKRREVDEGRRFAVARLFKYVVYTFAFILALNLVFGSIKLLLGGAAALLVGVGLGLQQTFNDLISGIILLVEGSVKKGDWIKIGSGFGQVQKIGLRTSNVLTPAGVNHIVPNSKITIEDVSNWTHEEKKLRFSIFVGVAYGSEVQLVRKLLLKAANDHEYILSTPSPVVRLIEFGDSSLNFELLYWSGNFLDHLDIQSDVRFEIDELFRVNNIEIPFPQRVITMKSN